MGMLDVGNGQRIFYETVGNPAGRPALALHGGPGSGSTAALVEPFDLTRYFVVRVDQRGCGASTPHAADPTTDMDLVTTAHLVADLEQLRLHLRVERWLLYGVAWGSTLALAYAEAHPGRVNGIVLQSVSTTRRSELDWLYRGAGCFLPEAWERFRDGVPPADRGSTPDLLAAYARLTDDPDPTARARATLRWVAWEDALHALEPGAAGQGPHASRSWEAQLALARIGSHVLAAGAGLEDGALIRDAGLLAAIPGVLVHGRFDIGSPLGTAWELAQAWPSSELMVIDDAGPARGRATADAVRTALARLR